jgi:tetratricopeptide (TPR) repeat protein
MKSYDKALDYDLDLYPDPKYNKGLLLDKKMKKRNKAIEWYEKAVKGYEKQFGPSFDPGQTWYNKGLSLYQLYRYEEAKQCFCKAKQLWLMMTPRENTV